MQHTSAPVLEWLVPDVAEFEARHWERAPLLISRESPAWYDGLCVAGGGGLPGDVELAEASCLFSHARLLEILRDAGPLPYHASMRVVRSERGGGGRAEAEPPADGLATEAWVAARLHEGYTVQLFRPQLYCSRLWSLLEALECRLQCLSGASVYLTPPGCQGLAPHHDDVEVFILQTEGTKRWRVYAPAEGAELPSCPSADLPREALGPCLLDATLRPGDLLYLPRGFVHEASCSKKQRSTHVTLSTYQQHSVADLLSALLPEALKQAAAAHRSLRAGLPWSFLSSTGTGARPATNPQTEALRTALGLVVGGITGALVGQATDQLGSDFFVNRLPPAGQAAGETTGPPPFEGSGVELRLCALEYRRLVLGEFPKEGGLGGGAGAEEEEGGRGGGLFVQLQHCLNNAREEHMARPRGGGATGGVGGGYGGESESESEEEEDSEEEEEASDSGNDPSVPPALRLTFPRSTAPALEWLGAAYPKWVPLAALPGAETPAVLTMLAGCWSEGVLHTRPRPAPASAAGAKRAGGKAPKSGGEMKKKKRKA